MVFPTELDGEESDRPSFVQVMVSLLGENGKRESKTILRTYTLRQTRFENPSPIFLSSAMRIETKDWAGQFI